MTQTDSHAQMSINMVPFGDSAILIRFGNKIDSTIHRKVQMLSKYVEQHSFPGFIECVPAFTSVTVFYNPVSVYNVYNENALRSRQLDRISSPYKMVCLMMEEIIMKLEETVESPHRIVEIPVCYGGEYGPDLEHVAKYNNLTIDEVIAIHSNGEYLVYMIGFAPGFPFLGGMSERIATPRRSSPRTVIPAGSVGIAGVQTGVYPIATPGGWQLIGRTPINLFLPNENPPSLLEAGDMVKFHPVSCKEYKEYTEESV